MLTLWLFGTFYFAALAGMIVLGPRGRKQVYDARERFRLEEFKTSEIMVNYAREQRIAVECRRPVLSNEPTGILREAGRGAGPAYR